MFCQRYGFEIPGRGRTNCLKPLLEQRDGPDGCLLIAASHPDLGVRYLYAEGCTTAYFTENETNDERVFRTPNPGPYTKDGINDCVVSGRERQGEPRKIRHESLPPLFTRSARRGKPCGPVVIDDDRAEGMARPGKNLRKGNGGQEERRGRILCLDHTAIGQRRRCARDAAGSRRHAVEQTVLQL